MDTEPKAKGRKPKGRKYTESLQIPCTPEFREEVEKSAAVLRMTVPEFLRYTTSLYMEMAKNASPHDQDGEYLMHLLRSGKSLSD